MTDLKHSHTAPSARATVRCSPLFAAVAPHRAAHCLSRPIHTRCLGPGLSGRFRLKFGWQHGRCQGVRQGRDERRAEQARQRQDPRRLNQVLWRACARACALPSPKLPAHTSESALPFGASSPSSCPDPPPPFLSPEYTLDSHMQSRCAICMSKTCRYRKSIELVRRWRTLRTYKRRTRTGYFPKPLQLTSRRWRVAQWPAWPLLDRRVPPLPGKGLKRTGLINSLDLARKESKSCRVRVRVV